MEAINEMETTYFTSYKTDQSTNQSKLLKAFYTFIWRLYLMSASFYI